MVTCTFCEAPLTLDRTEYLPAPVTCEPEPVCLECLAAVEPEPDTSWRDYEIECIERSMR